MENDKEVIKEEEQTFSGTIYLFYVLDMGDDVNLEQVKNNTSIHCISRDWPKYLKSYHRPLTIELPTQHCKTKALYANLHHFGALSIVYQIPFRGTLSSLREKLNDLDAQYKEQSIEDAHNLFNKIEKHIDQPKFFHLLNSYLVIAIDPEADVSAQQLRENHGSLIASTLRFEKTSISPFQVEDILKSATGYYREDLVIIDTEAAFVYDKEATELIDFFELATVEQLELRYFDQLLDNKLDALYLQKTEKGSLRSNLPLVGTVYDSVGELSKLKVDISVITERLGSSIKTVGEVYYSEIYELLVEKLELNSLRKSIEKKLGIIRDVRSIFQNKINHIREFLLSALIIVLIMIELLVAVFK